MEIEVQDPTLAVAEKHKDIEVESPEPAIAEKYEEEPLTTYCNPYAITENQQPLGNYDSWNKLSKIQKHIEKTYYVFQEEPDLVLPSAPSDKEKYSYLITHRFWLCFVGVFGFLASSVGLWLFTLCSPIFSWFAPFAAFIQVSHFSLCSTYRADLF